MKCGKRKHINTLNKAPQLTPSRDVAFLFTLPHSAGPLSQEFGHEGTRAFFKSPRKLEEEILGKTEDSRDSVESLFKAAADSVSRERYDLVLKRYRQILAREPDNEKAKAGLYDFIVLWTLYRTDAPASQIQSQYKRIEETVKRNAVTLP